MSHPRLTLVLSLALIPVASLTAQDPFSPFGAPFDAAPETTAAEEDGDPFAAQPAGDAPDAGAEPEPDLAVEQLLSLARGGPQAIGRAVASLARMGQWEAVDSVLTGQEVAQLSAEGQAEVAQILGPSLLVRIPSHAEISESSARWLREASELARQRRQDAQPLEAAIGQLGEDSVDAKLGAIRRLLSGGDQAIAAIVSAIVAEQPPAPTGELLRVLARLGPGGREALQQLALYGKPPQRGAALAALSRWDREAALADLLVGYHAPDSTSQEQQVAGAALKAIVGQIPSRDGAIDFLGRQLGESMSEARAAGNDSQVSTAWTVNAERTGVEPVVTEKVIAAAKQAYDAAARLRRIGDLPPELGRDALIADIGYRVVANPEWGTEEEREALLQAHRIGMGQLPAAIGRALELGDDAAAVGLLRTIDRDVTAADRQQLLRESSPRPTPLVRAASAGDPRVRFEAVATIERLAPRESYPGITDVRRTRRAVLASGQRPIALLVETRPDVSRRLESLLSGLGYRVRVAGSVRELQRLVLLGGDIRFIVAKTQLADLPPIELVDRVRRIPLGRQLPIAFYGDSAPGLGEKRWEAPTILVDEPQSTAGFYPLLEAVDRTDRIPPMTAADRLYYRRAVSPDS